VLFAVQVDFPLANIRGKRLEAHLNGVAKCWALLNLNN